MYEFDDDDGPSGRGRLVVVGLVAVALAAGGWFVLRPDDDGAGPASSLGGLAATSTPSTGDVAPTSASDLITVTTEPDPTAPDPTDSATTDPATTEPAATEPSATDPPTTTERATTTTARATTTTERATTTTEPPTTTTEPPTTTLPPTTVATVPSTTVASAPYPTLPDGTPEPVVATFDVGTVRLTGQVPSQDAVDRLGALALANSRDPANTTLSNELTINPAVPMSVGVRVLELTSARFPEGSATVEMEHAAELNRVYDILTALPNLTVIVVGHADQRGDSAANQELSDRRAAAVVTYLAERGIDRSRLSSRAVGENDLLTDADDDAALALNRRTEFIFNGLLVTG